jgi:predicted acyl esterase
MEPGPPYELSLELWATANVFLPGHRIRLEVASSNFPKLDRNSNTGGGAVTACPCRRICMIEQSAWEWPVGSLDRTQR